MPRSALGVAPVMLALAGCTAPATQLLVVVDTDYAVRGEVTTIRVTVEGVGVRDVQPYELAERGAAPTRVYFSLPLSFAVVPKGGDASRQVTVTAEALDAAGGVRVSTFARTGFRDGEARVLELFLAQRCVMARCAPGQTCSREGCTAGTRPVETLPRLPPGGAPALRDGAADGTPDAPDRSAPDAALDSALDSALDRPGDVALDSPRDLALERSPDAPQDTAPPTDTLTRLDTVSMDTVGTMDVASACPVGFEDCNLLPGDGCETEVATDPLACGACGEVCPPESLCEAGRCATAPRCMKAARRCLSGNALQVCSGGIWSSEDCPLASVCRSGECFCVPGATACVPGAPTMEVYCPPGSRSTISRSCPSGSLCDPFQRRCIVSPLPGTVYYPRLLAPLSGSVVSTRRPILRWLHADMSMESTVEVCQDAACTRIIEVVETNATRVRLNLLPMPPGRHRATFFWRVRGRRRAQNFPHALPWRFTVDDRSVGLNPALRLGAVDLDNNGYGDSVVGTGPGLYTTSTVRRVDVFLGADPLPTRSAQTLPAPSGMAGFGHSVAATDMNGDGNDDVIVASFTVGTGYQLGFHPHTVTRGVVEAPTSTATLSVAAEGLQLARAGDVNGDGYGDVVLGLASASGDRGGAWLLLGAPAGFRPGFVTLGGSGFAPPSGARLGASVAGVGDLDGDGFWDVAVGAPGVRRVYLFRGSAEASSLPIEQLGEGAGFGTALAPAGDMNRDGYPDIAVGSLGSDVSTSLYVLQGAPGAAALARFPITVTAPMGPALGSIGRGLSGGGDLNADGYDDLTFAATQATYRDVFWVLGTSTLNTLRAGPAIPRMSPNFGDPMQSLGDLDGDGLADLVTGDWDPVALNSRSLLYRGENRGLQSAPAVTWSPLPLPLPYWGGSLPH
ncbi:MAG: FG-GAP repeat protein [Deltaproteobacteria bacterium]|nr:FG-GAP repeat protein [Deltaproteobacteria bacterium]